jgi:rhodanese-related sulfurtransferase
MERLEEKKDKKILVYCASGYRSSNFKDYLIERGFDVVNLGGYNDAVKNGFEYETPSLSDDDLNCTKRCIKR